MRFPRPDDVLVVSRRDSRSGQHVFCALIFSSPARCSCQTSSAADYHGTFRHRGRTRVDRSRRAWAVDGDLHQHRSWTGDIRCTAAASGPPTSLPREDQHGFKQHGNLRAPLTTSGREHYYA